MSRPPNPRPTGVPEAPRRRWSPHNRGLSYALSSPLAFALSFALAACLTFAAGAPAQTKKAEEAAKKAAKEQQKLTEAEVLGEALRPLASANHDYGGHCGKAMGQVIDAIKILDGNVLKKGTPRRRRWLPRKRRS